MRAVGEGGDAAIKEWGDDLRRRGRCLEGVVGRRPEDGGRGGGGG